MQSTATRRDDHIPRPRSSSAPSRPTRATSGTARSASSIEFTGDKLLFLFGADPAAAGAIQAVAAASVRNFVTDLGSVILGPTDFFLLALHSQSGQNAAGVYKIRMGWWEL
jgi:hypothetical protein